ncbi:hypothetical protein R77567_01653 [Ralstonia sp. LMG 32965]|uniref:DUF1566 domain-containing protein n=1 Tax=Ralstonia flatus TaxID=3058601 RepID=A0AAD2F7Y5_9RALS|nr:DUF1566 domain-containing protein [Ralstonia sp. LMG 32965]MBN6211466.1 DUF1566 domain-containing protein [Ralstonia pickettii]CAJ0862493.1 hypothetical protein R77567_01653 [Ralstonia sp. LMG 32965]
MQQIQIPPLAEGEIYLCGIVNAVGDVTHTILLPAEAEKRLSWPDAMEWAKSLNADLPTRAELVIAFEQHRSQFKEAAYWSNTPDADPEYAGWAWYQGFGYGFQSYYLQNYELRARAVRRLTI